jgi:(p)ppGpp synthase/HD superfamily hydrolase
MPFAPRIDLALKLAATAHAAQVRKGTALPYITHPVHVSRLLERVGLSEELVVAGLLHDVIEDVDADDDRTRERLGQVFAELRDPSRRPERFVDALRQFLHDAFGPDVVRLVEAVTEQKAVDGRKRPWIERKREVIDHLHRAPLDVVALKAADVLHNVRSLLQDVAVTGIGYMDRFNAGPAETLWYYQSVATICRDRLQDPAVALAIELDAAVRELEATLGRSR